MRLQTFYFANLQPGIAGKFANVQEFMPFPFDEKIKENKEELEKVKEDYQYIIKNLKNLKVM